MLSNGMFVRVYRGRGSQYFSKTIFYKDNARKKPTESESALYDDYWSLLYSISLVIDKTDKKVRFKTLSMWESALTKFWGDKFKKYFIQDYKWVVGGKYDKVIYLKSYKRDLIRAGYNHKELKRIFTNICKVISGQTLQSKQTVQNKQSNYRKFGSVENQKTYINMIVHEFLFNETRRYELLNRSISQMIWSDYFTQHPDTVVSVLQLD
jgi:hypothetical protein